MVPNELEGLLRGISLIFKMERKQAEREYSPYFYTYFKSLFEDPYAFTQYSLYCEHILKLCQAKSKTVLDIGCGFGLIALHLAYLGADRVVAIDPNEEKISIFKRILSRLDPPPTNIKIERMDATKLDFDDECFDVAIANNVISHIDDRNSFLRETNRVLRYGGLLYLHDDNNRLYVFPRPRRSRNRHMLEYGPIDKSLIRGTDKEVPWLFLRRKMISERYPEVDSDTLGHLAKETAGMTGNELFKATRQYLKEGKIKRKPAFKFRNPETGEYEEFEFNPYQLKRTVEKFGFQGRIMEPHFSGTKGIPRRVCAKIVTLLYPLSLPVLPEFTILAKKVASFRELET